ncbi:hypothetical protein BH24ACT22_BH24ACT22_07510 [soil metagenome]
MEIFGADLRSLAIFRIVLALLVLADLANRATDMVAHYSDRGILSRAAVVNDPDVLSPYTFSLNLISGLPEFQALLFGVAALATLATLAMLAGYRTRIAIFIVWVLLLSIQYRNPLILASGDVLLRLLLFWSLFLPLGAVWSVDRARQAVPRNLSMRFLSFGTVALFLQIAIVYWVTAILKTGDEWRDGSALYYTLSQEQVANQLGAVLLNFPTLLVVASFATLALEAFGPFLLFSPFFTGPVRTAAIAMFMGLHFGIWFAIDIGIFPWISALCMVCFLPTWFWDTALPKLRDMLPGREFVTQRFRALRDTAARLAQGYPSTLMTRPSPAGFAEQPTDSRPASGILRLRSSLAVNLLGAFFLFYVLLWNVGTVSPFAMPATAYTVGYFLGLDQYWTMYAPGPPKDDGWWVIPGNLRNGNQADLISVVRDDYEPRRVSYEKPENIHSLDNNEHWRKYLEYLTTTEYSESRERTADQREQSQNFSEYLCRAWNERHAGEESLRSLEVVFMREKTLPDYKASDPERITLQEHTCGR